MQYGYLIGVCLDRYSEKGLRRVYGFCSVAVDDRNIPLLLCEYFWHNIQVENLDSIVSNIQASLVHYQSRLGTLQQFAATNLDYMYKWRAMNGLLDVVQAHYLDPSCPLPNFELTEESIRNNIDIEYAYQEESLRQILMMVDELNSPDLVSIRAARVQNWIQKHKVTPTIFSNWEK